MIIESFSENDNDIIPLKIMLKLFKENDHKIVPEK